MKSNVSKKNGRQVIWTIIGNGSYGLSQFLSIILIGKFLGTEDIGVYSLAIALTTPILIFMNLGMRMQLMTDINREVPISSYKQLQLINSFIGFLILIIICNIFYELEISLVILIVGLIKCVEYQSELYYGYLQRNNLNKVVSKSLFYKSFLFLLVLFLTLISTNNLILSLMVVLCSLSVFSYFYDRKNIVSKVGIDDGYLKKNDILKIIRIGIPLSLSAFLISMNINTPRLILGNYNIEDLGYFASIFAFMQIGTLFVMSLGQVLSGKMAVNYFDGNYKKYFKIAAIGVFTSFMIGIFGILFSYFFGNFILQSLYGYKGEENIMLYVFLFSPFQYMMTMFGYINGASRQSKSLFLINLPIFLIVSSFSLILIPNNGLMGAVWSMLLGFIFGCTIYILNLAKKFNQLVKT